MAAAVTYTTFAGELVHENRGGVESFFMPDTNGNVIGLIDDTGTVVAERTYWPFGEVMRTVGSWTTPFGFGGILGYFTDAVGKLYVRARYYRADLGRWQTVDPLWPGESAYGFVNGRPVDTVDPSGLWNCPLGGWKIYELIMHWGFGSAIHQIQCFRIDVILCTLVPCVDTVGRVYLSAPDLFVFSSGGSSALTALCAKACKASLYCLAACALIGLVSWYWIAKCLKSTDASCIEYASIRSGGIAMRCCVGYP